MVKDIKEFDKLIKEKEISDVDTMLKESKDITKNIPNLKEKHEKIVNARGNVLEASIKIEMAFDELITKTGGEDLVIAPEKKELHLITGAIKEDKLLGTRGLRFADKIEILRKILKKMEDEITFRDYIQSKEWEIKNKSFVENCKRCSKCGRTEQLNSSHIDYENFGKENISDVEVLCWSCLIGKEAKPIELPNVPESPLLRDLKRIAKLRNIFAHVPVRWFAKDLEFDDSVRYQHFFNLDKRWKNVSFAVNEFMNLQKEVLNLIPIYVKSVILKREIFSNILLGKSYEEVLKEAKDNSDSTPK